MRVLSKEIRSYLALLLLLVATLVVSSPLSAGLPDTIARVKPSIVGIGTYEPTGRPQSHLLGTGFVVADGYHVVTNAHVAKAESAKKAGKQLSVFVGVGKRPEVRKARVLLTDDQHDLALLRISGKALPTFELGDSDKVREGELYAFTGFPIGAILGLYPVTHRGIIASITPIAVPVPAASQLNPTVINRLKNPYKVFQLDATAYPGNSGSPLYHPESGKVIGVINRVFVKESKESVLEKPSGISYAIPVIYLQQLLEKAGIRPVSE